MAFSQAKLGRVGPQNDNQPTLWTYKDTTATLAAQDGSGYFNGAAALLKVGDFIFGVGSTGYGISVVVSNTRDLSASPPVAGVVDISNFTAVGSINSD